MRDAGNKQRLFSAFFNALWLTAMSAAAVTGFAHLPFAFRYGLVQAWRASPSVGHYWAAVAVMMLIGYMVTFWLAEGRHNYRLTTWGKAALGLVGLLMLTGLAMILHNLPSFSIYGAVYAWIKLGHLLCAVLIVLFFTLRKITGGRRIVLRHAAGQRRRRQGL